MEEWAGLSASALTKAIQEKKISSAELLEYFIERYERLNPGINAIVATNLDQARKRAAEADDAQARGENWGPLHGLPMTLKDNLAIKGMPMTDGSPLLKEHMPEKNGDVVQDMLDAGVVVFGKTNLPLFAMDTQSFNEVYGQTNNPWDITRTPGGSSGGAGAALAAGLTGLEIGNDVGGSIRIPANFCGIYGHKPSYNIVSLHGAINPLSPIRSNYPNDIDLWVNGPLARSAVDLKLAMEIITGPPSYMRKAVSISLPEPRKKGLKDFKVGVWLDDPLFPTDNDVGTVLSDFVDRLSKAGVKLINSKPVIDLKRSYELRNIFQYATQSHLQPPEIYEQAMKDQNNDDELISSWAKAIYMEHRDWNLLNMERSAIRQKWDDYFNEVDIMLCPVTRIPAHTHDHTPMTERMVDFNNESLPYWEVIGPWNSMALVAYLPATVAPAGFTPSGLPVGIQIIGPYLEDMTPIQFAIELEKDIIGPFNIPEGY